MRMLSLPKAIPFLLVLACAPPIEDALRSASQPERDALLREAVNEAGFECDGVNNTIEFNDSSWRVSCSEGLSYLAVLDSEALEVDPLPAFDPPATPMSVPGERNGQRFIEIE
jgi:hypothetical protein